MNWADISKYACSKGYSPHKSRIVNLYCFNILVVCLKRSNSCFFYYLELCLKGIMPDEKITFDHYRFQQVLYHCEELEQIGINQDFNLKNRKKCVQEQQFRLSKDYKQVNTSLVQGFFFNLIDQELPLLTHTCCGPFRVSTFPSSSVCCLTLYSF